MYQWFYSLFERSDEVIGSRIVQLRTDDNWQNCMSIAEHKTCASLSFIIVTNAHRDEQVRVSENAHINRSQRNVSSHNDALLVFPHISSLHFPLWLIGSSRHLRLSLTFCEEDSAINARMIEWVAFIPDWLRPLMLIIWSRSQARTACDEIYFSSIDDMLHRASITN